MNTDKQQPADAFKCRHIGASTESLKFMLKYLGFSTLEELGSAVVPRGIQRANPLEEPEALNESEALSRLRRIAEKNTVKRSLIGMGFYGTHTPAVISRNIFENPGWYTSYTPYQPEISQGRLEALMNFQTAVADLTALDIANASLLDEASAAAEAMAFCRRTSKSSSDKFYVSPGLHPQNKAVIQTRAHALGIELVCSPEVPENVFGAIFQYPDTNGNVENLQDTIEKLHSSGARAALIADLLSLTLLTPPGELGADIAVGSTQRFGMPMSLGGPHAGYMAVKEKDKRSMPGRLVGISVDSRGKTSCRLALQTREQHIRREKATSNICTAQALPAIMAGAYAVYHGPERLTQTASRIHSFTGRVRSALEKAGFTVENNCFFDTLTINCAGSFQSVLENAEKAGINLRARENSRVSFSLDELTTEEEALQVLRLFAPNAQLPHEAAAGIPTDLRRKSAFLTHPVFHSHHSETGMMRYLRHLADKDLALDRSMIPLGSCTMKLNAAAEMIPLSWPELADIHPFAPVDQFKGYLEIFNDLERILCDCTGYDAVSLQPNSGAQGEYTGLLTIKAYHEARGEAHRNICLIPQSAHGTNPASAAMAGMQAVAVKTDEDGSIDMEHLKTLAGLHAEHLAAIMVTYPSTHGVFEDNIKEVCRIIHENGGQVYLDGANLQAMVGWAAPGEFGSDVSHLNLHKTFAIPHGGGGGGAGPIGVRSHLAPYLPGHPVHSMNRNGGPVCAAPWGSPLLLPITWMYISMLGGPGLREASMVSVLNANYIAKRLQESGYSILYSDKNGLVAHECIVDVRPFKKTAGITVDDIAKRLMDFGFHAPTMSFPVPGTLMVEPTESEPLEELDRFCNAMAHIRKEMEDIASGKLPRDNNPLVNAPHTVADLAGEWERPYSREEAVFPTAECRKYKYITPVNRIDNAYGDRHLVCCCPPLRNDA